MRQVGLSPPLNDSEPRRGIRGARPSGTHPNDTIIKTYTNSVVDIIRLPNVFSQYEVFHVSSPGAAREREIMLFSACV